MPPVAVPAKAHRLPGGAALGQLGAPCKAAVGIGSEGFRPLARGPALLAEQLLGVDADHGGRDVLGGHDLPGGAGLLLCGRRAAPGKNQPRGDQSEVTDHVSLSPSDFTQINNTRPIRKSPITGDTPMRALPLMAVTVPISAGATKAVARPDNP